MKKPQLHPLQPEPVTPETLNNEVARHAQNFAINFEQEPRFLYIGNAQEEALKLIEDTAFKSAAYKSEPFKDRLFRGLHVIPVRFANFIAVGP